jgi:hypothetical protein
MKKPTKAQTIAKKNRCEKLLKDKDLQQAFEDVKNALHRQFDSILPSEVDKMIQIKERLHLLDSIEENLKLAIKHGKLAEFQSSEQISYLGDLSQWRKKQ